MTAAAPLTKKNLRETALARRLQMSPEERALAQHALLRLAAETIVPGPGEVLAAYWPVKGEADPRALLARLAAKGVRTALPVVVEAQKPLAFRLWREGEPLIEGRYGIMEPDPAACPAVVPHIVLVPLLAFDGKGQRLGYGSGFYDRTFDSLSAMHHPFRAFGLAFEAQKLDLVPAGIYDYPMDAIITEKTVRRFPGRPA